MERVEGKLGSEELRKGGWMKGIGVSVMESEWVEKR